MSRSQVGIGLFGKDSCSGGDRSPFFNQKMRCLFTGNGCDGCEPESVEIEAGKDCSLPQEHRRHGQVDLIDLAGGQVLTNRSNAATNPNVFAFGRRFRFLQGRLDAIGDKVKGRAAVHRKGRARVMREDKDRRVVRRILPPPALPGLNFPGTAHGAEQFRPKIQAPKLSIDCAAKSLSMPCAPSL